MGFHRLAILVLSIAGLTACTQDPEWTLFYFENEQVIPEHVELSQHISGYYGSIEHCMAKGEGMVKLSQTGVGSYQCGHQCVATDDGNLKCKSLQDSPAQ